MTITAKPPTGAELAPRDDLVTLTIDDVEVSVPKGTLVIRAAELIGIEIPRFCDHPLLEPVGACRQCLVEVPDAGNGRPIPKPQASCTLEVAPGMQIRTQVTSPVADKAQRGNIEFLLINHPLDCPICDKGGECPLQNQAMTAGPAESRFADLKRTYPKPINISAQVLLDRERCVLCARCTRFSEQIAGDPFIALIERGALQQVGIYERQPLQSYFAGNTIQICPVGALTSVSYRFRARPFDLVSTPSIAEHDACGSAIRVDHRRGAVMRRLAGDEPEVNEEWITDKDRFAFTYGRGPDRLSHPLVRDGDKLRPASWPEAIDVAVRGLRRAGQSVGVLTGGRLSVEDCYAYAKFARAVLGTNNVDFRSRPHSVEEADFLAAAVAGRGVSLSRRPEAAEPVSFADLEQASAVLLVAFEPEEEAGAVFLRLRKAYRQKGLRVWTVAPFLSNGARKAGATLIPTVPGSEAMAVASLGSEVPLGPDAIILVGERAALTSGTLTAALRLARRTGARLAWIPRRAGDRGAVEAGCLPNLLPGGRPVSDPAARVDTQAVWDGPALPTVPGRDADEMLISAAHGDLEALVVGGLDPADFLDRQVALQGLEGASFLVSLETRASLVTERADVVLPVALLEQRSGTFLNWEGRERAFPVVLTRPDTMSDLRVLAALSDGLGVPLGFRTAAGAKAEMAELGAWEGSWSPDPDVEAGLPVEREPGSVVLATWRQNLDASSAVLPEPTLLATAPRPVARLSPALAQQLGVRDGDPLEVGNDRGTVTFPVSVTPGAVDGVVWVPTNAALLGLSTHLGAGAGDLVRVRPATRSTSSEHPGSE